MCPYTCVWIHFCHPGVVHGMSCYQDCLLFEWSADLIAKLLYSDRVGIELDLNISFGDVAKF